MADIKNRIVGYKKLSPDKIVRFHAGNPRAMDDAQARMLERSVTEVGFVEPIIVRVNDEGQYEIVNGHHRYDLLVERGVTEIPSVIIDVDDEVQLRTIALGTNRIAADYIPEDLEKYLQEIVDLGGDLDFVADISGMRHDDIEMFKELDTGFLNEYKDDSVSDKDEGGFDTEEGLEPGTDGDAEEAEETPVPMTFNMIPADKKRVTQALRAVQQREGTKKLVDSLIFLCDQYLETLGSEDDDEDEEN